MELVGELADRDKAEFLRNAAAFMFPVRWPEPFGPVVVEALACGTPVLALNGGSVPEVIHDGVTGSFARPRTSLWMCWAALANWTEPNVERRPNAGSRQPPWPLHTSGCTRESSRMTRRRQRDRGFEEPMLDERD